MTGGWNRRLLLAVAAVAGTGTAFAADDDTLRLGRFQPADTAKDDSATLDGKGDDTELIHWRHRGFYGGGFYSGFNYGRSYYGGGFGYSYYRPAFGYSYYRPSFVSYSTYYAPPVYYSAPVYYSTPSYYYGGFCPIGGVDAVVLPLGVRAGPQMLPGLRLIPRGQEEAKPIPPADSFQYDGDPKAVPTPMPMPMSVPDAPRPSAPPRAEDEGVRVSLPVKPQPSKYKYAAYGEKR